MGIDLIRKRFFLFLTVILWGCANPISNVTLSFPPQSSLPDETKVEAKIQGIGTFPVTLHPDGSGTGEIGNIPEGNWTVTAIYFLEDLTGRLDLMTSDCLISVGENGQVTQGVGCFGVNQFIDTDGDGADNLCEVRKQTNLREKKSVSCSGNGLGR